MTIRKLTKIKDAGETDVNPSLETELSLPGSRTWCCVRELKHDMSKFKPRAMTGPGQGSRRS